MEVHRQKNVATYIVFPIVDADGDFVSSAADLDSEIDAWSDGSAPDGFADCTNEATEIGSSGIYYLKLEASEVNYDYVVVQVKTSTSGAKTQMILINTKPFTEIDAIYDKLPTNYIMGSSDQTDKDDEIDDIKSKTDNLPTDPADESLLEAKIDALNDPSSATIADAVWNEAISGHTSAGTFGAKNQKVVPSETANDYKADVSALATSSALATVDGVVDAIKNKTDNLPSDTEDFLDRILGLLGKYAVWEYTWTGDNNTTVGIWIYDNSTNFANHDKSTGLLGEWEAVVTYSSGKPSVKKIEQKQ